MGPVPEEGVSRLVTQHTNERRDHYERYGIALILEHGFMVCIIVCMCFINSNLFPQKTAKGQKAYAMNIAQIRNATLETSAFFFASPVLFSTDSLPSPSYSSSPS